MRRICLRVAYDGTNYAGWQRQPNLPTVQGEIERNLRRVTGEEIDLHGSGRTDAGVHALGQVAHFDSNTRIPADKFVGAINVGLPPDIRVLQSVELSPDFHARFSAKRKHYRYTIRNARVASALQGRYELHLHKPLDIARMQEAASFAFGEHDFAAFAATGSKVKKTVRRLYQSELSSEGDLIYYDTIGNGYLYNMVRMLVGAFIDVGYRRLEPSIIRSMLENKVRVNLGSTAPAHGLTLVSVDYDEDVFG